MESAESKEPLDVVARKIETLARKADDQVIAAALLVREARRRVEAGEAGDIKWYGWAPKNINLSVSRLRELQRIAEADDPAAEIERQRKLTQKRVENYRERQAATKEALDPERRRLIAWAKVAPIERVKMVLRQAGIQIDNGSVQSTEEPSVIAHQEAA